VDYARGSMANRAPRALPDKTAQAARSALTRARLMRTAERLFAQRGYANVGTNEIVRAAKTTRGGLYYHFKDKKDLFRAVHEQVEERIAAGIATKLAAIDDGDLLEMLRVGVSSFLDLCMDPRIARIALVDAPSILGWKEWREVDERHGLGLIIAGLELGVAGGMLAPQPVKPLAHLLLGAVGEAGMMVADAPDPKRARKEVEPALIALVEGLRQMDGA
jgi:AcrR family transcriptional regulator